MRKQPAFLKDITDATPVRGDTNTALRIQKDCSVDDDAPAAGADQPGDRIDDRGFAGARAAKQRRETPAAAEMDIELERCQAMLDVDLKHGSRSPQKRGLVGRYIAREPSASAKSCCGARGLSVMLAPDT